MSTPLRVGAFVAGLLVVFAAAVVVGRAVGPVDAAEPAASHGHGTGHDEAHEATYRLALADDLVAPGDVDVRFRILDEDGAPVTAYDVRHEKELHLVVVDRRDLRHFQHVHPVRAADGTWTARLRLGPGTPYRMYADASTGGSPFVAEADLATEGSSPGPEGVPAPAAEDRVDGFVVRVENPRGTPVFTVTRNGRPVMLEPYLGALGHLVVIRADSLSYLHVHPEEGTAAPTFAVTGLQPGRYRYFLDFQVGGAVHTAAFTVDVPPEPAGDEHAGEGSHDHDH